MDIRNVAIIAHVDHGKTTLVDALLRQSNTHLNKEQAAQEFIMDSNDLEKERGITIFSKNASVDWKGTKINIIDTPGHADFGGEVERVLKMADGCLLLVDAQEGPMAQTRFVLKKALDLGLKVIVVMNKIDKPNARIDEGLNKTFDLFMELGASDAALDFPIIYSSSRLGKAGLKPDLASMTDISPIFDEIIKHVPAPKVDPAAPLQMLATNFTYDSFKGRIATGRVYNGVLKAGSDVAHITREGEVKRAKLTSIMTFIGLERVEVNEVEAGDIAAIAGIADITIGETITDLDNPIALPLLHIEEPTVKMTFGVNTSPVAGTEGEFSTSRQIRARLYKELETDVALKIEDGDANEWAVSGRGELHLGILIERLRREGYELQVSQPQAVIKMIDGKKMTPYEQVYIEVPEVYSGAVIQKLGIRGADLKDMRTVEGATFLEFTIPTSGLLGYRSQFMTDTKGTGIINSSFLDFKDTPGRVQIREHGSLVSFETGLTNLYGMVNAQDRGELFIQPGVSVYKGQVVGRNSRADDISVNVCKAKALSNMRSQGTGGIEHFNTPREVTLDFALEYIGNDELMEVTPKSIRIRKMILDEKEERRLRNTGQ